MDGQRNKVIICVFLLALCQSCQSSISYRDFVLYFRQVDPSDDKAPARTWCSPPSSEMWLCQGQVSEQQMSVSEGSTQLHITLQLSQWEWWNVRKRETVMTWNSDDVKQWWRETVMTWNSDDVKQWWRETVMTWNIDDVKQWWRETVMTWNSDEVNDYYYSSDDDEELSDNEDDDG